MAVVVIGGTSGVGRSLVLSLLESGQQVIIGGRNFDDIRLALNNYSPENFIFNYVDLSDQSTYEPFWSNVILSDWGIDTMVLYAGVTDQGGLTNYGNKEHLDLVKLFQINLISSIYFCSKYVDNCISTGVQGHIIFTGTGHMYAGEIDRLFYAISKGGLLTLMRHIVRNYSERGIRANMVMMGWTLTEGEIRLRSSIGFDVDREGKPLVERAIPLTKSFIPISDLVDTYFFLCIKAPRTLTNSILKVNGGERI